MADFNGQAHQVSIFPGYLYSGEDFALDGIALRSNLLGLSAGFFAYLVIQLSVNGGLFQLPLFFVILSVFHFLEYFVTARYNTKRANVGAFLLTSNGSAYTIAHTAASIEALVEHYFFPSLKRSSLYTTLPGILLIFIGQIIRSLAMIHASTSFNHHVAYRKQPDHILITHGVYKYFRHPSYFGFFVWGVGTQIMLTNPICSVGYAIVLWRFFNKRIEGEEFYLVKFFGKEYKEYRERTRTWIPFIR